MSLTLLDWRRQTGELYRLVRAQPDPATAHRQWQAGRNRLFFSHPASPLSQRARRQLQAVPVAPYDPDLRLTASLDPLGEPSHLEVVTGTDGVLPLDRIGVLRLPALAGSLDVWWLGSYGGGLFVPVKDGTAGATSYPGGRYLWDTAKGADLGGAVDLVGGGGQLVVDLNFLYHPSCAYDAAWACPLAPQGNVLSVGLHAGEQLPAGGWPA